MAADRQQVSIARYQAIGFTALGHCQKIIVRWINGNRVRMPDPNIFAFIKIPFQQANNVYAVNVFRQF